MFIGKRTDRKSGVTGSIVPGCRTGDGGTGMSAFTLYQAFGRSDSSNWNLTVSAMGPPLPERRDDSAVSGRLRYPCRRVESIVVTGGAGFIGSTLVRLALAQTPDRVVVVDKLTYSGHRASLADVEKHPRFTFVEADIADRRAMRSVMATHRPRAVLNFAAETHVDRSIDGPDAFVRTNINGTYELLEASRAHLATRTGGG